MDDPRFFDVLARRRPAFTPPRPVNDNAGVEAGAENDTALVIIDVQRQFCDPSNKRGNAQTDEIAGKIASIVPAFRAAGIPVYAVYYSDPETQSPGSPDWFKFEPANSDILVPKTNTSAFGSSSLDTLLRQNHHRHLLVCGFNLNACITRTIAGALQRNYDVTLLQDLAGNDSSNTDDPQRYITALRNEGARIITSEEELRKLAARKTVAPVPALAFSPAP